MATKLIKNLATLGIEITSGMENRPKRSYGGPKSAITETKSPQAELGFTSSAESEDTKTSTPHNEVDSASSFDEGSPRAQNHELPTKVTSKLADKAAILGLHIPPPVVTDGPPPQEEHSVNSTSAQLPKAISTHADQDPHTNGDSVHSREVQNIRAHDLNQLHSLTPLASNEQWLVGKPAPIGMRFCPIQAIQKLPYKIMHNDKVVAPMMDQQFFNEGKFWRRTWTLFYIWPVVNEAKPLVVVPAHEVEVFFNLINGNIRSANLSVRRFGSSHTGFCIEFASQHARLRPRFLGTISSQEQYQRLQTVLPGASFRMTGEAEEAPLDEESVEVQKYDTLMFQALDLGSNKKKGSAKRATPQERLQHVVSINRDWESSLKQVQRFLGLRPVKPSIEQKEATDGDDAQTWAEIQAQLAAADAASHPKPIDDTKPAPFSRDSDVIFICLDVEAWERDNKKITEIGICLLDTRDLLGVAPGQHAKNWFRMIRAQHFRIQDHSHLRNGDFVVDHAGNFKFGNSEWLKLEDAPAKVASLFRPPTASGTRRTLVLVGHDVNQDIRFLLRMGYDVSNLGTLHKGSPKIDTQNLYRAVQQEKDHSKRATLTASVRLSRILEEYDITPWGLHNAGNDAVYTLQAMLAMAVESAKAREAPAPQQDWNADMSMLRQPAVKKDENDGWDDDLPEWKRKGRADDDWSGPSDAEW